MFGDKYSLSILNSNILINTKQNKIDLLKIYNDVFDGSNACSSPHLICWTKDSSKNINEFWKN